MFSALASVALLWTVASARSRAARLAISVVVAALLVAQLAFYRYYHAPLDDQVAIAARQSWGLIKPVVVKVLPSVGVAAAVVAIVELAVLELASRARRTGPRAIVAFAIAAALVVLGGSPREGTMEVRAVKAAGAVLLARPPRVVPGARRELPPLVSRRARLPNVLYVVTESVRASDHCDGDVEPCPMAPATSALLPARATLRAMRSIASYTAISMSALLTGRLQLGPRSPLATAPDLFDLARATRSGDERVTAHYWSAQTKSFFEREAPERAVDSYVDADLLLGHAVDDDGEAIAGGLDRAVAAECERRMPGLAPPFLAVTHLIGTHAPYFFDDDRAAFTPFDRTISFSTMAGAHNAYKSSIVEQDASIAKCVNAFLAASRERPWVVVYTSDHGESFGEHAAIHHGQNLYDEQIHVPAFVAWGNGALEPDEEAHLRAAARAPTTHLDLLPTVLDALGVLDAFAIDAERAAMPGRSLLRALPPPEALPLTNCSEMWQCTLNAWGVAKGSRKLFSQPWDGAWRCLETEGGEREVDLAACEDLVLASRAWFPRLPNGNPNL